jgi:hypothetical protein
MLLIASSLSDPPYFDPSMLPQYATVVLDVVDITLVILTTI